MTVYDELELPRMPCLRHLRENLREQVLDLKYLGVLYEVLGLQQCELVACIECTPKPSQSAI
jgi:hypothetical protein